MSSFKIGSESVRGTAHLQDSESMLIKDEKIESPTKKAAKGEASILNPGDGVTKGDPISPCDLGVFQLEPASLLKLSILHFPQVDPSMMASRRRVMIEVPEGIDLLNTWETKPHVRESQLDS